jgi:hypothetical protein
MSDRILIVGEASTLDEVNQINMIYKIFLVGLRARLLGKIAYQQNKIIELKNAKKLKKVK